MRRARFLVIFIVSDEHAHTERHVKKMWDRITSMPYIAQIRAIKVGVNVCVCVCVYMGICVCVYVYACAYRAPREENVGQDHIKALHRADTSH